jgi:nitrogen fixation NifU-like protein
METGGLDFSRRREVNCHSPLNCDAASLFLTPRTVKKETTPVNEELYDDYILDHYECPYHKGHLECPTCTHSEKNPLCGDQIRLELKVGDDGHIAEAFFNGKGCAISQAGASILCQHVEGKSLDELRGFQAPDMLRLLKVPLTATRQRCGLLGFKVLKTMMYSLEQPPIETDEAVVASSG